MAHWPCSTFYSYSDDGKSQLTQFFALFGKAWSLCGPSWGTSLNFPQNAGFAVTSTGLIVQSFAWKVWHLKIKFIIYLCLSNGINPAKPRAQVPALELELPRPLCWCHHGGVPCQVSHASCPVPTAPVCPAPHGTEFSELSLCPSTLRAGIAINCSVLRHFLWLLCHPLGYQSSNPSKPQQMEENKRLVRPQVNWCVRKRRLLLVGRWFPPK